jgi:hypothetical protein
MLFRLGACFSYNLSNQSVVGVGISHKLLDAGKDSAQIAAGTPRALLDEQTVHIARSK